MKKLSIIEMISISYEWGGIEQHVKDVSAGLVSRGHNVHVVCRDVEMYKQAYGQVCPVHVLPIRSAIDLVTVRGLAKLITEHAVDVIHTHTSRDSWLALFASWLAGRGKVVTTRHVPLLAKQDAIHTWYYNQLAGIICVSQFVKNKFLGDKPKINTKTVQVIHPGIRTEQSQNITDRAVRNKLGIDNDTPLIGFVGRVTVEKGLNNLINAIAILKNKNYNFCLVIVGDVNPKTPEYIDELKQQAEKLEVSEYVHFYGFTKDVPSVMHDIDILVLPSSNAETFGLVLCEAMLAGKPVITTNNGAQGEIVEEGVNGFLVPVGESQLLADKLEFILQKPDTSVKMGENGRESVMNRYSLSKMVDKIEELFLHLSKI